MVREDKAFMGTFVAILGVLVGIAILIFIVVHALMDSKADDESVIAERIKPVGQVTVGEPPAPEPDSLTGDGAEDESADPRVALGKQVYEGVCAACHASGVAGAPKFGDKAAWEERLSKGIDQVYATAIAGKGGMPPKGGRVDLSDEDFKAAVDYVAGRTSQETAPDSSAGSPAPEEAASGEPSNASAAPSAAQAGAEAAESVDAATEEPATASAPTGGTGTAESGAGVSLPDFDEADLAAGKQIYDGLCFTCHASGVAGAPKFGDKAAWAPRLSQGLEQVYAIAIAGKGGMPPKGGRVDLSDEEFKRAVNYMVNAAR